MHTDDPFLDNNPEALATFVQEYVRNEDKEDAGSLAVIASQLRDPRYLPHQVAEYLLAKPEIQAAVKVLRAVSKPRAAGAVSIESISMDMETLYQEAKQARQFTAAIGAKKLQAEIAGFLAKDININVRHTAATMSDSELETIAKRGAIEGEFTDVTPLSGLPSVINANR